MAVDRREKTSDEKYLKALGVRPAILGREPELEDVIEDLRDDVNALSTLSAINENKNGITAAQASNIEESIGKLGVFELEFIPPTAKAPAFVVIKTRYQGKFISTRLALK